jgi:hypothetical protein
MCTGANVITPPGGVARSVATIAQHPAAKRRGSNLALETQETSEATQHAKTFTHILSHSPRHFAHHNSLPVHYNSVALFYHRTFAISSQGKL